MEIFEHIAPLKAYLKELKCLGNTIGLVPTMGSLHAGHVALIKASQQENKVTVGSIFVNPTQFNNENDLLKYPRSIEKDTVLLKSKGCDVLFCPSSSEMYPEKSIIRLDFGYLDKVMEGQYRPGHFSGVGLVVSKLFNIVEPDHAYFGQKDWQQFTVIQKLVADFNFNVILHHVDTLREEGGLALSSRNLRLDQQQRKKAIVFYSSLVQARAKLKSGVKIEEVKKKVKEHIEQYPDVMLEYFELADSKNLNLLNNVEDARKPIMCIAGYVGEVRLIDNMFLE